ncbi:MAG: thiol-disulfide oxidoreductase DCC family protein [Planctomycetota bacterium]
MPVPTRQPTLELTVWFDGDCGLCKRIAGWLRKQPKYVTIHCVPAQHAATDQGCPLDTKALLDNVTVVASDGAVYRGTNAWLTVLWALRNYRRWSLRMSKDRWRPWAEDLFASISGLARWTKSKRPVAPKRASK